MRLIDAKTPAQLDSLDYNDKVSRAIGERFREIRAELGLTQGEVGDFFGVSFQQIQKYENGTSRFSASRLFTFLQSHEISFSRFFEHLDIGGIPTKNATTRDLNLYRKICNLEDPFMKKAVIDFIHRLGRAQNL